MPTTPKRGSYVSAEGSGGSGGSSGSVVSIRRPVDEVERLWTYEDVSSYLGMSIAWVRREVTMRRIDGVRKLGRATRFIPSEVMRWAYSRPVRN